MIEFDPDLQAKPGETAFQWARRTGMYSRLLICTCCMIIEANGDPCGTDECGTCADGGLYEQAWSRAQDKVLTLGDFTDECGHDLSVDSESEAHSGQCERYGFHALSCDLCGTPYHGDRYRAVLWPREIPEEHRAPGPGCTCDPCASCRMRHATCCPECAFCVDLRLRQEHRAR